MDRWLLFLADGVAAGLLLAVIVEDARRYRIRNTAIAALTALSAARVAADGGVSALGWHAAFGLAVLGLMTAAFALRLVGAGDAKLMAAACFRAGGEGALIFAIVLLLLSAAYALGAVGGVLPARRAGGRLVVPFGPSIAGAWLATLAILNLD